MAKTMPVPVRLAPHIRAEVEKAAHAKGQSLSSFLEMAGLELAQKILSHQNAREILDKLVNTAS
jgi:uncharacterized protein (DUF1778 family)